MSAHKIEAAIIHLTSQQLVDLLSWLEEDHTKAGRLAVEHEAGREQSAASMAQSEDLYIAVA